MVALEPNKSYTISTYQEPPIEVIFLKKERGFYVFLYKNQILPVREQYLQVVKENENE